MNDIRYFVSGHTSYGFVNHLQSNLQAIKNVYVLSNPSSLINSYMLKEIKKYLKKAGLSIEIVESSDNKKHIYGLIVRQMSIAFLSSHIITRRKDYFHIINNTFKNKVNLYLKDLNEQREENAQHAYNKFKKARLIHDQLEKVYVEQMDFQKANEATETFISDLFKHVPKNKTKKPIYKRFFGTTTAHGVVNNVQDLIKDFRHRIYIKGRPGTGKSYFMKAVLEKCKQYNLEVEIYYCSFDPYSIDMLIIRELDCCLFDSTDPHEFHPERESDKIIDLYDISVKKDTDERFKDDINRLTIEYRKCLKEGVHHISLIKEIESKEEKYLSESNQSLQNQALKNVTQFVKRELKDIS